MLPLFVAITTMSLFAQTTMPTDNTFRDCEECLEMVVVPAGKLMIGSPENEPGRTDVEGPQKEVGIKRFAAGKYDVTRGEWTAFV